MEKESKLHIPKDEEYVEVHIQDEKTGKIVDKMTVKTRINIFQPVDCNRGWFKKKLMKLAQLLADLSLPGESRDVRIHKFLKNMLLRPALKIMQHTVGKKYIIKEDKDIVRQWHNNHIRIFRHCYHQSTDDIYRLLIYGASYNSARGKTKETFVKEYKDGNEFLEKHKANWIKKGALHHGYFLRNLLCDIWVTEMLQDTADREWCNFFNMRVCHEMMQLYGVSMEERKKVPMPGQYPLYTSGGPYDHEYFVNNVMIPEWIHPIDRPKMEENKDGRTKEGSTTDKGERRTKTSSGEGKRRTRKGLRG